MCLFKRFSFDFKEMHALANVVPPGSYLLEKKKKESLWLQSTHCVAYKASLISSVTAKKMLGFHWLAKALTNFSMCVRRF